MSIAKSECVAYVEFVRKIEQKEISGWMYGVDQHRRELHDRMCAAYGIADKEKTKKFTLWLDKYLDRAHGEWEKIPELLHDDLTRIAAGEEVKPPERGKVDTEKAAREIEKIAPQKSEHKSKCANGVIKKFPISVDLPNLLKELVENGDIGCAQPAVFIAASLLNKISIVSERIQDDELNYYLARLGMIQADGLSQAALVHELEKNLRGAGAVVQGGAV